VPGKPKKIGFRGIAEAKVVNPELFPPFLAF
jgi:hypothetical protein